MALTLFKDERRVAVKHYLSIDVSQGRFVLSKSMTKDVDGIEVRLDMEAGHISVFPRPFSDEDASFPAKIRHDRMFFNSAPLLRRIRVTKSCRIPMVWHKKIQMYVGDLPTKSDDDVS